jgi:hypothetical protein
MKNKSSEANAQRQFGDKGEAQVESLMPDLLKITKARRIKEVVLIHVWPSGIKAFLGTNSYF